jgi:mannitol/fructose-specific phosphotransferase system IIA component (Ntr-type)
MAMEKDDILFSSLFSPAEVICQTDQTDRDNVLLNMLRLLAQRHNIGNIEDAHEAVLARESDLATVVAPGLAMPHARLGTIDQIVVAVATSKVGIVYDPNQSDNHVKLIVLTLTPKATPGAYLQTLGCLARICQDPSTADVVAALPTPRQVWEFFDRGGAARRGNPKSESRNPKQIQMLE